MKLGLPKGKACSYDKSHENFKGASGGLQHRARPSYHTKLTENGGNGRAKDVVSLRAAFLGVSFSQLVVSGLRRHTELDVLGKVDQGCMNKGRGRSPYEGFIPGQYRIIVGAA